jgi:ADP-dependent NAD(P)H-hydrate dehydratase / NAD(P)H-hydrate epimerase
VIGAHLVEDVRGAEAALMASLPDGTLMQRAAGALAARCARLLAGPYGARVVLLVGGGDNGGDALYAGARLARRGARVDAVLVVPDRAHGGGLRALRAAGGRAVLAPDADVLLRRADLVVDGLLGIGGHGGLRGDAVPLADTARETAGLVVAVDLPSGVEPDTGEVVGPHVRADVTVTFGTRKVAHVVDPAAAASGYVVDVDIGLAPLLPAPAVEVLESVDVAGRLPLPGRTSDKYSRGVVGVAAGSPSYAGAAVLATGGAVRGGAGMVRYAGTGSAADLVRARWPETVVAEGRVQAWTVGSGLGSGEDTAAAVGRALADDVPVLVDADGLAHLPDRVGPRVLLTPHAGELARMLGVSRSDVEARRLRHAREAARRWDACVLLKGATTVVVAPDGRIRANPTGTPVLATAGSGDVLAGLGGAMLAGGLDPLEAGSLAAYVHGLAGQVAAERSGAPSAQDLLAALPEALRRLGDVPVGVRPTAP